jgi:type II secretory pathway pseudopilin PulG
MLPKIHLNQHKRNRAFSIVEIAIVLLIVSLLMAGILNGTSLISDASVATAQKLTTNSEVNTIESLSLWLESSFASSFQAEKDKIENDAKIMRWKDISPLKPVIKKFDLQQGTSANRPQYKEDVINGLPLLYFSGSGTNFLEFTNTTDQNIVLADVFLQNQATIFMVAMFDNSSAGNSIISFGTNDVLNFGYNSTAMTMKFATATPAQSSNQTFRQKQLQMLAGIKTDNNISFYLNGNLLDNASYTSIISDDDFGTANNMRIRIGANFKGWLGEVLVFNKALTDKERIKVEQYLLKKWKIK